MATESYWHLTDREVVALGWLGLINPCARRRVRSHAAGARPDWCADAL